MDFLNFLPSSMAMVVACTFIPAVNADFVGTDVNIITEYTDSPFMPGGEWFDYGYVLVGADWEWSSGVGEVLDWTDPAQPQVGWYQHDLDIGADYIDVTVTWENFAANGPSYFSLLPGDFYGFHLRWDEPVNIASAVLSVTGDPVHVGELDLFSNPGLEWWVDSMYLDPNSQSRVTINEFGLDINTQGIAWEYDNVVGDTYSATMRVVIKFVPSPGALVLLGIAGLRRRRRL